MNYLAKHNLYNTLLKYDFFLIDIWGVVHNGEEIIDGFLEFYNFLTKNNKKFSFLSNSPRPFFEVKIKLESLGLDNLSSKQIFTSGDYFLTQESKLPQDKFYHHIGQHNHPLINQSKLNYIDDLIEASYLIITYSGKEMGQFDEKLEICLSNNITILCPNPDIKAPVKGGFVYTPGYIAEKYNNMGGKVIYYGKPHKGIYDFILEKQNVINKESVLMIGDSLLTDIKGANSSNIDSLLVLTGNHKYDNNLEKQLKDTMIIPTYIVESLKSKKILC